LTLMVLFYIFGTYSGAHVNPAVSFGFACAGRMSWWLMIGYWIAQIVGAIAAAALVMYFFGQDSGVGASVGSLTNTNAWEAVLVEAFLTFFLVLAILFVTANPWLAIVSGIIIGAVLTFDMLAGYYLTGASMNPARSLGPAIFSNNLTTYWIYVVGPLIGALVAAIVYWLLSYDYSSCLKRDECGKVIVDECCNPIRVGKRPVLDRCGNQVVDCNGCKQWEEYVKHDPKLDYRQATPFSYYKDQLRQMGLDVDFLKEKAAHIVKEHQIIVDGVVSSEGIKSAVGKYATGAGAWVKDGAWSQDGPWSQGSAMNQSTLGQNLGMSQGMNQGTLGSRLQSMMPSQPLSAVAMTY